MKVNQIFRYFLILCFGLLLSSHAFATVFNIPDFVLPDSWSVGLEPQLHLEEDSGLGIQLHFKKGITDLTNFSLLTGIGDGPKRFRVGGNFVFDFFPDLEKQPGAGIALQAIYFRNLHSDLAVRATGQKQGVLELTVVPYIHKSFVQDLADKKPAPKGGSKNGVKEGTKEGLELYHADEDNSEEGDPQSASDQKELDPFVAIPLGWNYSDSHYQPISSFVLGLIIKFNSSIHASFELNMPIHRTKTVVSGGVSYFY